MDIQGEIAEAIVGALRESAAVDDWAAAVMPIVERAQAEAQAEVLVKVAENADELQHTREEVRERIYDGYSVDWARGYDEACAEIAKWARGEIEIEGKTND